MAISAQVTNRTTGGSFILRFGMRGPNLTAIATQFRGTFGEDPAIFLNAINRWREGVFNKELEEHVGRVLRLRSKQIATSELQLVSASHERAGGTYSKSGTSLFHLRMNMKGESKVYGPEQEVGRAANKARSPRHYMVPVASYWGNQRVTKGDIDDLRGDPNVRWLPYGRGNYYRDKAGRAVKFVFRFNNIKSKAESIQRAGNRAKGKVKGKKEMQSLEDQGQMLFLAYRQPQTTGIPGKSRGAFTVKAQGYKSSSPLARDFGFATVGGIQASRWFTYSLVKTLPRLDTMLKTDSGALKGAMRAFFGAGGRTGSSVFYE